MWSSPQSSVLVWTGCKQSLSWRRSPSGSTCELLWSTSGCNQKRTEWWLRFMDSCLIATHPVHSFYRKWRLVMFKMQLSPLLAQSKLQPHWQPLRMGVGSITRKILTCITKVTQAGIQLTSETCDQFLSPHYMGCDALHLVCLSRSECWQSPSCHRLTLTSCRSHLQRQEMEFPILFFKTKALPIFK